MFKSQREVAEETKARWAAHSAAKAASRAAAKAAGVQAELFHAIKWEHSEPEAKQLIRHKGADPNGRNEDGETPLTAAAECNIHNLQMFLIEEKKVDVNVPGKNGNTALILATENSDKYGCVMRYLIKKKAKVLFELISSMTCSNSRLPTKP